MRPLSEDDEKNNTHFIKSPFSSALDRMMRYSERLRSQDA